MSARLARRLLTRSSKPFSIDFRQVYVPLAQDVWAESYLLVRASAGSAATLMPDVRSALARVDVGLPVRRVQTLEDVATAATARYRFRAVLVVMFSALSLALATIGVFGVLAYSVQQRWREFGVRTALGATPHRLVRLVFAGAARPIGIGAAAGLVAAAAFAHALSAFLFGVRPLDPVTFTGAALLLGVTAALAIAIPALRASRVDPVIAFRNE